MLRQITILLFLMTFSVAISAQWLTGWTARQVVELTENSGNTLSNYQVRVDVAYAASMQADFSDIRFTTSDGLTPVDFWLETYTTSTSAVFWVEVPSLSASAVDSLYLYYGNTATTSASNGPNTFIFFDDFSTFTGWNNLNGGGVSQDVTTFAGQSVLHKQTNCDPAGGWKSIGTTVNNFRLISRETRVTDAITGCEWNRYGLEDANYDGYTLRRLADVTGNSPFGIERRTNAAAGNVSEASVNQPRDRWYRTELVRDCVSGLIQAQLFADDKAALATQTATDAVHCGFDRLTIRGGRSYYIDVMAVANYVVNEPTVNLLPEETILPLQLLNFELEQQAEGNLLTWELAQQDDVQYFTIEYSADALQFQSITELQAAGLHYEYLDAQSRTGELAYYRLKAHLTGGAVEYSPVRAVRLAAKAAHLSLWPNPANEQVTLSWNQPQAEEVEILIIDVHGRVVKTQLMALQAMQAQIQLPIGDLPNGYYMLTLKTGTIQLKKGFIKQ